jgi:hypothetical protein
VVVVGGTVVVGRAVVDVPAAGAVVAVAPDVGAPGVVAPDFGTEEVDVPQAVATTSVAQISARVRRWGVLIRRLSRARRR